MKSLDVEESSLISPSRQHLSTGQDRKHMIRDDQPFTPPSSTMTSPSRSIRQSPPNSEFSTNDFRQELSFSNLSILSEGYSSTHVPVYDSMDIQSNLLYQNTSIQSGDSNETASTVDNIYLKDFRDTLTHNSTIDYDESELNELTLAASSQNSSVFDYEDDAELRELALSFTPGIQSYHKKIDPTFSIEDSPSSELEDDYLEDISCDDDLSYELNRLSAVEDDLRAELASVSNTMMISQKSRRLSPKGLVSLADESDDDDEEVEQVETKSFTSSTVTPFTYGTNTVRTPTSSNTCCTFSDFDVAKYKSALASRNMKEHKVVTSPTPPSCLCM